jgi:hypothetical protein
MIGYFVKKKNAITVKVFRGTERLQQQKSFTGFTVYFSNTERFGFK